MNNLYDSFTAETLELIDLLISQGQINVVVEWIQEAIWNGEFLQCCDIDSVTAKEILAVLFNQ